MRHIVLCPEKEETKEKKMKRRNLEKRAAQEGQHKQTIGCHNQLTLTDKMISVKYENDGVCRRTKVSLTDVESFAFLCATARILFPSLALQLFDLEYRDEDEDDITTSTNLEIAEAIHVMTKLHDKSLKFKVVGVRDYQPNDNTHILVHRDVIECHTPPHDNFASGIKTSICGFVNCSEGQSVDNSLHQCDSILPQTLSPLPSLNVASLCADDSTCNSEDASDHGSGDENELTEDIFADFPSLVLDASTGRVSSCSVGGSSVIVESDMHTLDELSYQRQQEDANRKVLEEARMLYRDRVRCNPVDHETRPQQIAHVTTSSSTSLSHSPVINHSEINNPEHFWKHEIRIVTSMGFKIEPEVLYGLLNDHLHSPGSYGEDDFESLIVLLIGHTTTTS